MSQMRFYREYTRTASDDLTAYTALVTTPDGHPAIGIALCYCGSQEEGERVAEPVRAFGPPLVDLIRHKLPTFPFHHLNHL